MFKTEIALKFTMSLVRSPPLCVWRENRPTHLRYFSLVKKLEIVM